MKIIVAKPGTFLPENKKQLEEKGIIVIEVNKLSDVKVLSLSDSIDIDDLSMAALSALVTSNCTNPNVKACFVDRLYTRMVAKEQSKKAKK